MELPPMEDDVPPLWADKGTQNRETRSAAGNSTLIRFHCGPEPELLKLFSTLLLIFNLQE